MGRDNLGQRGLAKVPKKVTIKINCSYVKGGFISFCEHANIQEQLYNIKVTGISDRSTRRQ